MTFDFNFSPFLETKRFDVWSYDLLSKRLSWLFGYVFQFNLLIENLYIFYEIPYTHIE